MTKHDSRAEGRMAQPVTIHQFCASVREDSPILAEMRFIRESLEAGGIDGRLLAFQNPQALDDVEPFRPAGIWNGDLVLVHHSGPTTQLRNLLRIEIPKVLIHHPLIPTREPSAAAWAEEQARQLQAHCLHSFGPSGFPRGDVGAASSRPPRAGGAVARNSIALACIGELEPYHRQALWVHALYYLNRENPKAFTLKLFGSAKSEYARYVTLLARSLGVQNAVSIQPMPARAQTALADADALLVDTDDANYFWPLVAGLRQEIPIFYHPARGVKRALHRAGVRLATRKPHRLAEAIRAVFARSGTLRAITRAQTQRLAQLENHHSPEEVRALCLDLVQKVRYPFSVATENTWTIFSGN